MSSIPLWTRPNAQSRARDGALAVAVGLLALLLYAWSPTPWLWLPDGPHALEHVARGEYLSYHFAYLPSAHILRAVFSIEQPADAARFASNVGAAIGLAFSYLLARHAGARRMPTALGVALIGCAPAVWFFAIQIEVHAVQFGAVALGAWLTMVAPWRSRARALLLAALGLGLAHCAHQSTPALGPGWVLLVGFAARRQGVPWRPQQLLFVVGPILLAGLFAANTAIAALGAPTLLFAEHATVTTLVNAFHSPASATWWERDIARPLGYALVGIALGFTMLVREASGRGPGRAHAAAEARWELGAIVVLLAVPTTLFAIWAVDNRGGYLAASTPFLVWLIARAGGQQRATKLATGTHRSRIAVLAVLAIAVVAQVRWGWADIDRESRRYDRARHLDRAAAVVAQLPAGGVLISFDGDNQSLRQFTGAVEEKNWLGAVLYSLQVDESPDVLVGRLMRDLDQVPPDTAILLELSHRPLLARLANEPFGAGLVAIEAALAERFHIEPIEGSPLPLARLRRR